MSPLERAGQLLESVATELIVVAVGARIRTISRKRRELEIQTALLEALGRDRAEKQSRRARNGERASLSLGPRPDDFSDYLEARMRRETAQRRLEQLLDEQHARNARPSWVKRLLLIDRAPGLLAGLMRAFYHLGLILAGGLLLLTFGTAGSGSGTVTGDITIGLFLTGLTCSLPYVFFVLTRAAERRYERQHESEEE